MLSMLGGSWGNALSKTYLTILLVEVLVVLVNVLVLLVVVVVAFSIILKRMTMPQLIE